MQVGYAALQSWLISSRLPTRIASHTRPPAVSRAQPPSRGYSRAHVCCAPAAKPTKRKPSSMPKKRGPKPTTSGDTVQLLDPAVLEEFRAQAAREEAERQAKPVDVEEDPARFNFHRRVQMLITPCRTARTTSARAPCSLALRTDSPQPFPQACSPATAMQAPRLFDAQQRSACDCPWIGFGVLNASQGADERSRQGSS